MKRSLGDDLRGSKISEEMSCMALREVYNGCQ